MLLYQTLPITIYEKKNEKVHTKRISLNISSYMKWGVLITWWIVFCIRYSRILKIMEEILERKTEQNTDTS